MGGMIISKYKDNNLTPSNRYSNSKSL